MQQMRRFLDVDSRGRVSVARFGFKDTQLLAVQNDDGSITLEEVVPLTRAEIEHFTDPAATRCKEVLFSEIDFVLDLGEMLSIVSSTEEISSDFLKLP